MEALLKVSVALLVGLIVLAGFSINGEGKKAEACKAQDGVYLYREGACLKNVIKIPAIPPEPQVQRTYPTQSCPSTQFTCKGK